MSVLTNGAMKIPSSRETIAPNWEGNVLPDDDDKAKNKTDNKHGNVPPPWCFLIMLGHVRMMSIVISPLSCTLIRPDDIPAPKEKAVGNQGTDLRRNSVPDQTGGD
jgi:hypothetical protein